MGSDFNALVEAELERHARQWEKTEERLYARIGRLREESQKLKAKLAAIEAVLDDYYGSPEPRSTIHALDAIYNIVSGRTEVKADGRG